MDIKGRMLPFPQVSLCRKCFVEKSSPPPRCKHFPKMHCGTEAIICKRDVTGLPVSPLACYQVKSFWRMSVFPPPLRFKRLNQDGCLVIAEVPPLTPSVSFVHFSGHLVSFSHRANVSENESGGSGPATCCPQLPAFCEMEPIVHCHNMDFLFSSASPRPIAHVVGSLEACTGR